MVMPTAAVGDVPKKKTAAPRSWICSTAPAVMARSSTPPVPPPFSSPCPSTSPPTPALPSTASTTPTSAFLNRVDVESMKMKMDLIWEKARWRRDPLWRGRVLTKESIQAVQALKLAARAHRFHRTECALLFKLGLHGP